MNQFKFTLGRASSTDQNGIHVSYLPQDNGIMLFDGFPAPNTVKRCTIRVKPVEQSCADRTKEIYTAYTTNDLAGLSKALHRPKLSGCVGETNEQGFFRFPAGFGCKGQTYVACF